MLRLQLLLLYRLLVKKERLVLLVSTVGAAICVSSFILLNWYARYEETFDGSFDDAKNIYRVQEVISNNSGSGQSERLPFVAGRLTPMVRMNMPSLVKATWISPKAGCSVKALGGKDIFYSENSFLADSCFFGVFSVPFVYGNRNTALNVDHSIVISESFSRKVFGDVSPLNRQLRITWGFFDDTYTVTGVFKDIPPNSHLDLDLLYTNRDMRVQQQEWHYHYTYLRLKEGTDKNLALSQVQKIFNDTYKEFLVSNNVKVSLTLKPIMDIHLRSDMEREIKDPGDYRIFVMIKILSIVALLVFMINYLNLSSSLYVRRIKELQLRITVGATPRRLFWQFVLENCLQLSIGAVIAVGMVFLCVPWFSRTYQVKVDYGDVFSATSIIAVIAVMLAVSALSSLSGFLCLVRPRKGIVLTKLRRFFEMKNVFLGLQYLSVGCIIFSMLVIEKQLDYMQHKELGFDKKGVLILTTPPLHLTDVEKIGKVRLFMDEVKKLPGVLSASNSLTVPGRYYNNMSVYTRDGINGLNCVGYMANSDYEYLSTFGIHLIAGRDFYHDYNDNKSIIINETLRKSLLFKNAEDAIGKQIKLDDIPYQVAGVIADSHQDGFRYAIQPWGLVMVYKASSFISVKMTADHSASILDAVHKVYANTFPDAAFNYTYLDQYFDRLLIPDTQLRDIFMFFSLLMMILVSVGLFGISSFVVSQRVKEIAIRKVLGASFLRNLRLIGRDYLIINGLFLILSLLVSFFLMRGWLDNFAYRTELGLQPFLIPLLITFPVTIGIVVYNVFKVDNSSSVNSLKSL